MCQEAAIDGRARVIRQARSLKVVDTAAVSSRLTPEFKANLTRADNVVTMVGAPNPNLYAQAWFDSHQQLGCHKCGGRVGLFWTARGKVATRHDGCARS